MQVLREVKVSEDPPMQVRELVGARTVGQRAHFPVRVSLEAISKDADNSTVNTLQNAAPE
jgi:hypothetical protein